MAAGSATLGLLVGLGQLSGAAQARRTIEWTSTALSIEKDAARQTVLQRLKLRAQGYLIAAQYVPWWRFSEAIAWTLLAPALVILGAHRSGEITSLIGILSLGVVTLTAVARRAIRLYSERMRVSHQFAFGGADVEPVQVDILAQMEGGTRPEFALGLACAITVMGTAGLLAWALVEGRGSTAWIWVFVGGFSCWSAFQLVHGYAMRWSRKSVSTRFEA